MFSGQVLGKCFVPSIAAAIAVEVKSKEKIQKAEEKCLIRPSELPLYKQEPPLVLPPVEEKILQLNKLEDLIRTVRVQLVKFNHEYESYKKVGVQEISKRKEDVDWLIDYLREEDNTLPKVGAIGIGALTGLVFGLRGGFIKKTLYATIGALGIGAICYPKHASEYGQLTLTEGRKYMVVSYNFVTGAKKEDALKELPSLPPLPTSLTQVWDSIKTTATSFISEEKPNVEVEKTSKSK